MSNSLGIAAVIAVAIGLSNEPEPGLSLTTLFAANNGFAGNTFDLDVLNPQGVEITGWDVNLDSANPTDTIDIYWRVGTSVGHENDLTGWMLIGSDAGVVAQGSDVPTPVDVGPLELLPGVYGIYVDWASYGAGTLRYTNGGPTVFANADLSLTTNTGENDGAFTGGSFFPRQWNGTIYYQILVLDSDGDGIPDDEDACPNSDLSPTIVIDGCDSGVGNLLFEDGCTMADMIAECADDAVFHGQFVACVALLAVEWRNAGLINDTEIGAIDRCAAIPGDLDGDGAVGVADLVILLGAWGPCRVHPDACPADLDLVSSVWMPELLILLSNWGS